MIDEAARRELTGKIEEMRAAGTLKVERVLESAQGARIRVRPGRDVLNFCANNYLGLAAHPRVMEAAHAALDRWGYGMSSVRFICGTLECAHGSWKRRSRRSSAREETILFSSCFDANGGVFEPLLDADCALITDQLNHASLIDGARLCRARRFIYAHADMARAGSPGSEEAAGCRMKLIVTDGVFSMDGDCRRPARDLPAGRGERRDGGRGRQPRHGIRRAHRPRNRGALRRHGTRGCHHHDIRQGAGRRDRRMRLREAGDHRRAAAAEPAIPLFQHAGARRGGHEHRRPGHALQRHGAARQAGARIRGSSAARSRRRAST